MFNAQEAQQSILDLDKCLEQKNRELGDSQSNILTVQAKLIEAMETKKAEESVKKYSEKDMANLKKEYEKKLEEMRLDCENRVKEVREECVKSTEQETNKRNSILEETRTYLDMLGRIKFFKPECQICLLNFSENPDRLPRVMDCGHSICTECCDRIGDRRTMVCPFDRKTTVFKNDSKGSSLPKNFMVLEMVNAACARKNDQSNDTESFYSSF